MAQYQRSTTFVVTIGGQQYDVNVTYTGTYTEGVGVNRYDLKIEPCNLVGSEEVDFQLRYEIADWAKLQNYGDSAFN